MAETNDFVTRYSWLFSRLYSSKDHPVKQGNKTDRSS